MRRTPSSPLCGLAATLVLLAACDSRKSDTETASATVTDSAAATVAPTGAIPISSASDEAPRLYLEGRTLSENLRAHDGRALFEQAAAKDPTFAMAHYQLAANAKKSLTSRSSRRISCSTRSTTATSAWGSDCWRWSRAVLAASRSSRLTGLGR